MGGRRGGGDAGAYQPRRASNRAIPSTWSARSSVGSRLGGHLVQGHVDAVGTIVSPPPDLEVALDEWLAPYVVEKGSITVDGISLTVVAVAPRSFRVAIIPHTLEVTTLGRKVSRRPGQPGGRRDRQVRRTAAAGRHRFSLYGPRLDTGEE